MSTISTYTNDDAIADGFLGDVTPASMKAKGWKWIITSGVHAHGFSPAAIAELFNEVATAYNEGREINPLESSMNEVKLWLFLESDEGAKVFKVILPEEY